MADRVNKLDRVLFRKALIEVFAEKYDGALADSSVNESCSAEHEHAIKEIVARAVKSDRRKIGRKWLIAILVAALLLLSACVAYVCRGEIRDFIEKAYDKYIRVAYNDGGDIEDNNVLASHYTLGYVPEGYNLAYQIDTPFTSKYKWETSSGDSLVFEQHALSGVNFSLDTEEGEKFVFVHKKYEVYCWISDAEVCLWNDGLYAYKIKSSQILSNDQIKMMIDGMVLAE